MSEVQNTDIVWLREGEWADLVDAPAVVAVPGECATVTSRSAAYAVESGWARYPGEAVKAAPPKPAAAKKKAAAKKSAAKKSAAKRDTSGRILKSEADPVPKDEGSSDDLLE